MSDIYFDESAVSIVDEWIKDVDSNPFSNSVSTRVSGMAGDSRNNFGLGFDGKSKGATKADGESNTLIDSIKKKKLKAKALANKDMHYELHGVVDDTEELSRTSITSSKTKAKPRATVEPRAKPIEQDPLVVSTPSATGGSSDRNPSKRPKTRSKQKNIRRDKRAAEHKPTHLQIGSKEYRGRPITAETKQILGIERTRATSSGDKRPKKKQRRGDRYDSSSNSKIVDEFDVVE